MENSIDDSLQNIKEMRCLAIASLRQMELNSSKKTRTMNNGHSSQVVTPLATGRSTGQDSTSNSKLHRAIIARPALRRSTSSLGSFSRIFKLFSTDINATFIRLLTEKKTTSLIAPNKPVSTVTSNLSRPKQDFSKVKSKVGSFHSGSTSKETVSSTVRSGMGTIASSSRLSTPKTRTSLGGNARLPISTTATGTAAATATATAPAVKNEMTGTKTRSGRMSLPGTISRTRE